jgi:acyl-CoA thioesterase I
MMGDVMSATIEDGSRGSASSARRSVVNYCSALLLTIAATGLCRPALAQDAKPAAQGSKPTLLVIGDSLSAEYGIPRGSGWVALLERRLAQEKLNWRVVNASVSGDTTAGGRARLPAVLAREKPALVVIELGGNDALRGLPLTSTRDNLKAMTQAARQAGAQAVVVGMQMPPNYGRAYGESFAALFEEVARTERAALVPFLLTGVADVADSEANFQPDRIHPVAKVQPRMLDNVWPVIKPLLTKRR